MFICYWKAKREEEKTCVCLTCSKSKLQKQQKKKASEKAAKLYTFPERGARQVSVRSEAEPNGWLCSTPAG
jgi:hypothetical protein